MSWYADVMVVPRNPKSYKPPRVKNKTRFYLGFVSILFAAAMLKNNENPPYLYVSLFGIGGVITFLSSISILEGNEVETNIIH